MLLLKVPLVNAPVATQEIWSKSIGVNPLPKFKAVLELASSRTSNSNDFLPVAHERYYWASYTPMLLIPTLFQHKA